MKPRLKTSLLCALVILLIRTSLFALVYPDPSLLTRDKAERLYPGAQVVETTWKEYSRDRLQLSRQGLLIENRFVGSTLIASTDTEEISSKNKDQEQRRQAASGNENDFDSNDAINEKSPQHPQPVEQRSTGGSGGIHLNVGSGGSRGGGDAAAVLLLVIGVVVVAVLIFYGIKYIYNAISDTLDEQEQGKTSYWWDIGFHSTFFDSKPKSSSEEENINQEEPTTGEEKTKQVFNDNGKLYGIKLSSGIVNTNGFHMGLAAEVGIMSVSLNITRENEDGKETRERLDLEGGYGMIGPALRFEISNTTYHNYVFLELLAGTTVHKEVGVLSIARMGGNWGLSQSFHFGVNVGGMLLNLKNTEGIIRTNGEYDLIYGVELGYRL